MNERRTQPRIPIHLTNVQWAVIAEALGQMVKIHASRLESVVQEEGPGSAENLSAFDALSRTYADLVRELAQAGLADMNARAVAQTLDQASAVLESRLSRGDRH